MSFKNCMATLAAAAGRELTDDEADFIVTQVRKKQDFYRRKGIYGTDQEAIIAAAQDVSDKMTAAAKIEKRNAALNIAKKVARVKWAKDVFGTNVSRALETMLVGTNYAKTGARDGVAQIQAQIASKYLSGFAADLKKSDLLEIFAKGGLDKDVFRAAHAIGTPDEAAIHAKLPEPAVRLAKIIDKWQEASRVDANKEGAWISKTEGYGMMRTHDSMKIMRAGKETWKERAKQYFDTEAMLADNPDADVEKMLDSIYIDLATGNHVKVAPTRPEIVAAFKGASNVAKRMSQARTIVMKDADSAFAYNQEFGTGNLRETVVSGLRLRAEATGLMRVLGTNPDATYDAIEKELTLAAKDAGDIKAVERLEKRRKVLSNYKAAVDGSMYVPGNAMGAKVSANVRSALLMAKLGGMIFSQLNDLAVYASNMKFVGRDYFSSLGESVKGLGANLKSAEKADLLASLGVVQESIVGELGRIGSLYDPGSMTKMTQLFMKLNLSHWWTEHMRASAALGFSHHLALNNKRAFTALNPDLQRTLGIYGIDEARWNLIRSTVARESDGRNYIVPEAIRNIPDADIMRLAKEGDTPERLREGLENQLRNYIVDRTGFAVTEPDAKTRAILYRGTRPGTMEGETARFLFQFKSFTAAYMQKQIGRELYGRGFEGDSVAGALANGNGEVIGLASLILMSTAAGYATNAMKDVAKGKEPRDIKEQPWQTFLAAMVTGGGAGIYGDFLFGDANRFGSGTVETLAGPAISTGARFLDLYHRGLRGDDVASSAMREVLATTPFVNLFYTRAALDYLLLWRIQDQMNPGWGRRYESAIRSKTGQDFYLRPSEAHF